MKFLLPLLAILLSASFVNAQNGGEATTLIRFDVSPEVQGFYSKLIGDVDADGTRDLLIGAPYRLDLGVVTEGAAYVYSGSTGTLIHQIQGTIFRGQLGADVSDAGDVNADGFDDFIVSAPGADYGGFVLAGVVYVHSGLDASILYEYQGASHAEQLGWGVNAMGDLNSDGFDDFSIPRDGTTIQVYSGADGLPLLTLGTGDPNAPVTDGFTIGDWDGDGIDDIFTGNRNASPNGIADAGSAFILSGANSAVLQRFDGLQVDDRVSGNGKRISDTDGDGVDDFLIGAIGEYGVYQDWGKAHIFSGASGVLLDSIRPASSTQFGFSVSGCGDVDGDGIAEFLIGDPGTASIHIYSGKTKALLVSLHESDLTDNPSGAIFGYQIWDTGDSNGDSIPDFFIPSYLGDAYLAQFDPFSYVNTDQISVANGAQIDLEIDFPNEAGFMDYITLLSVTGTDTFRFGLDISLTLDSFFVDSLSDIYPFPSYSNMVGTLDINGDATASVTFPAGSISTGLIGRKFWLATIALAPGLLPEFVTVTWGFEIVP